jgi:4-amino-4-deoxy-L-arabinose transferase-like glycosyltransferase
LKSLSYFLLTLILVLITSFSGLLNTPFYTRGEPREALVAKQMIHTGNWILPRRYGERLATKPPLLHWSIATVYTIADKATAGLARVPVVFFSIAAILLLFNFVKSERSAGEAFTVCLCLILSAEWSRAAHAARVDMLLASSLCLAWISYFRWYKNNFIGFPFFFTTCLILAVLSKGPVALVLPATTTGIFLFLRSTLNYHAYLKTGLVFTLAIFCSALWYVSAYAQGGAEFLELVYDENIARFTGTMKGGKDPHEHGVLYLYGTLIIGLFPWSVVYFESLLKSTSRFKSQLNTFDFKSQIKVLPRNFMIWISKLKDIDLYAFLIIAVTIIFFSFPSSKRSVYLLPLYPFAAIFIGRSIFAVPKLTNLISSALQKVLFIGGLIIALIFSLLAFLPVVSLFPANYQHSLEIIVSELNGVSSLCLLAFLFFTIYLLVFISKIKNHKITIFYYLVLTILLQALILPAYAKAVSAEYDSSQIKHLIDQENKLYSYSTEYYEIAFYADLDIKLIWDNDVPQQIKSGAIVLLQKKKIEQFKKLLPINLEVKQIYESKGGIRKLSDILIVCEITDNTKQIL